jgi:hypothetical protein
VRSITRAPISLSRAELARGFVDAYGRGLGQQHVAGVHAGIHLEGRDSGLGLAADDGPRDGRGAAVARQHRGMDVDGAAPRDVEYGLGQDLAERDHDGDIGSDLGQPLRPAGITQPRG